MVNPKTVNNRLIIRCFWAGIELLMYKMGLRFFVEVTNIPTTIPEYRLQSLLKV